MRMPVRQHRFAQIGFLDKPAPQRFGVIVEHEPFIVFEDVPAIQTHLALELCGAPTRVADKDAYSDAFRPSDNASPIPCFEDSKYRLPATFFASLGGEAD